MPHVNLDASKPPSRHFRTWPYHLKLAWRQSPTELMSLGGNKPRASCADSTTKFSEGQSFNALFFSRVVGGIARSPDLVCFGRQMIHPAACATLVFVYFPKRGCSTRDVPPTVANPVSSQLHQKSQSCQSRVLREIFRQTVVKTADVEAVSNLSPKVETVQVDHVSFALTNMYLPGNSNAVAPEKGFLYRSLGQPVSPSQPRP